jgi:hypothetical protein
MPPSPQNQPPEQKRGVMNDESLPIELVNKLDELFPKGRCKERGQAMVFLAFVMLFIKSHDQQIALAARIEAAKHIDGKLMAEEPEVIASNRGEDEDNTWFKAQMVFSDYISEEIVSYVAELEATLKAQENKQ